MHKSNVMAVASVALLGAGCMLGPLFLNIVRLRYTDTPSSLAVTSIADQREVVAGLKAIPFFTSAAAGNAFGGYRGTVLPQAELSGTNRPTVSYTPLDDFEFTRRLFTPITLEGTAYLAKTTWPISTVFRLYLENLNWVSNAETGSGPTPRIPPEYAEFLDGILALQRLQDRKLEPQPEPDPATLAFEQFWDGLSEDDRSSFEAAAASAAPAFLQKQYHDGKESQGSLWQAARRQMLLAHLARVRGIRDLWSCRSGRALQVTTSERPLAASAARGYTRPL